MTTIAYRAGVMAADTQVTCGDGSKMRTRNKICQLPDGTLYACAGDMTGIIRLQRWMDRGMTGPRPRLPKGADVDLLMVKPDGSAWMLNDALDFELIEEDFIAIGSGSQFAIGAMSYSRRCSAKRAVAIAARNDVNTSAPIETRSIVMQGRRST